MPTGPRNLTSHAAEVPPRAIVRACLLIEFRLCAGHFAFGIAFDFVRFSYCILLYKSGSYLEHEIFVLKSKTLYWCVFVLVKKMFVRIV